MATLKEDSTAWKCTSIIARDFRHDKGDGYEDVRHKSKHGKKKVRKSRQGCPGNDNKAHVYVWTTESPYGTWWDAYFGRTHDYEYNVCAGCGAHRRKPYLRRKA